MARSAFDFDGGVSREEAEKFERIAASLVAKLGQVPNYTLKGELNMRKAPWKLAMMPTQVPQACGMAC